VDLSTFAARAQPVRLADVVVAAERNSLDERPTPRSGDARGLSWQSPPRVAFFEVDCETWWRPDVDLAAMVRRAVEVAMAEHPLLAAKQGVRVVSLADHGDTVGVLTLPPLRPGEVLAVAHTAVAPRVGAVTLSDGSYAVRVRPLCILGLVWDEAALGSAEPVAFARRMQQLMVLGPERRD
jgi:hypothetical protein